MVVVFDAHVTVLTVVSLTVNLDQAVVAPHVTLFKLTSLGITFLLGAWSAARLEVLELDVVISCTLTLTHELFLKETIDVSLRYARVGENATKKHTKIDSDTSLTPQQMPWVGPFRTQLHHHVEVGQDHGRQEKQENGEWPRRTKCENRRTSLVDAAQENTVNLSYTPILGWICHTHLVIGFLFALFGQTCFCV